MSKQSGPRALGPRLEQLFDVVVIGGGSNGVAVARDAALRGLKVALFEKVDFGYGTVSRSTRLIHGGLRYLELFDFGLVREGLREREILLRTAPHLVRPLAFFTPVYDHTRVGVPKLRVGMWLYDLLSYDKSIPNHTFLTAEQAKAAEPLLNPDGLRGAFIYYDGFVPMPERLCLEAAVQAAQHGAVVANHAKAVGLAREGDVFALTVEDLLTGESHRVRARAVINATGPWADELNRELLGPTDPGLRRTKGIHVLVPRLSDRAVVMLAESDGRLFFAVPWREFSFIGTTDTDFDGDLDKVTAEEDEVGYLLRETKRVFPEARLDKVYFATAGVRPLVRDPRAKSEGQVSRKHRILHHDRLGNPGYFSVLGGKITNMRSVAEETVDAVVRWLGVDARPCATRTEMFPGAAGADMDRFRERFIAQHEARGWSRDVLDNLVDLYGAAAEQVLETAGEDAWLTRRITDDAPDIWAQLVYGVRREWVYTTADFLLRRTVLGLSPGMAVEAAPEVARRLGAALGRTEAEIAADLEQYSRIVERMAGRHITGAVETFGKR